MCIESPQLLELTQNCVCLRILVFQPIDTHTPHIIRKLFSSPDAIVSATTGANAQRPNAQMPNAQIPNAQMPNAQMPNAQMSNAQMSNAQMLNARTSNAQMSSAQMLEDKW